MAHAAFTQDAFRTDALWKSSKFFEEVSASETSLFDPIELDLPSVKLDNPYAPTKALELELQLPDIELFQFGPLPELESLDQSSIVTDSEPSELEEDLWKIALDLGPANKDVVFYTWEGFENPGSAEPRSAYVAEAGPKAFDATLAQHYDESKSIGKILKSDVLLDSLINLGLGRSSTLFNYEAKRKTFVQAVQGGRASGLSLSAAQSLIQFFLTTGNSFNYLRSFVEKTYTSSKSIPAKVALASVTSSILYSLEDHLGTRVEAITSILQLQRLFTKPHAILTHVANLVDGARSARTNEDSASLLYQRVQSLEQGEPMLHKLSMQILGRVAEPFLEILSEWIGLQDEKVSVPITDRAGFVTLAGVAENDDLRDYQYNADDMPQFISDEDGQTFFETGTSLRFLRTHHPDHPLASIRKSGIQAPELKWEFSWEDFESISERAKGFQENLQSAIQEVKGLSNILDERVSNDITIPDGQQKDPPTTSDYDAYLQESIQLLDATPKARSGELPDELQALLETLLSPDSNTNDGAETMFQPPLSLTPQLSFGPILAAQARLVNATALRLFFRSHHLRTHFLLQRQYHLFGDGVFSSRLASALFDPEFETAQRQKGIMRSGVHMGLQLGSRTTWPPASSELRLALMGVLSESYHSSQLYYSTLKNQGTEHPTHSRREREELPGQLNFAIRNLSESEMDRVMDPDSLYALDFLRLQYVPPPPLHLVITSASLEKYDDIFKFLLRLTRMLFVVSHLPRTYPNPESRRFRNEAHHFVSSLATYIFQTGISEHWDVFERFINLIEQRLEAEDRAGELGVRVREGLESLKTAHDRCLDGIMFSLLLRRRQKKVMALLEEIFELILTFSKWQSNTRSIGNITDMYAKFKGKVRVFISVCRQLTGKRGYGKGRGTTEENTIDRLLVLLEMNGYYTS